MRNISKRLRKEVWEYRIGKEYTGKCSVSWCRNEFDALDAWHVGHNKPWIEGGTNSIDNLFPLCTQCNLSMNTMTIDEFSKSVVIPKSNDRNERKQMSWCFPFSCKRN